jgi:hypothetical protein
MHAVRGPTSFGFLETVEGVECQTFGEACQKLGLLENDHHWDTTMSEASISCFPAQLRGLFAIVSKVDFQRSVQLCPQLNGLSYSLSKSISEHASKDTTLSGRH